MKPKNIALYVALVLAVLAVAGLFRNLFLLVATAAVAAGVAYWVARRTVGEDAGQAADEAGYGSSDALPEWIDHLRALVTLNALVRESAFPPAVVAKLEEIFDELRRLLPDLNENYVGSELTWTVNRMSGDYVSRIVQPYVELSPAGRSENEAEFLRSLVGLESELANIENLVTSAKEGDFKAKAAFLRARFLEDVV